MNLSANRDQKSRILLELELQVFLNYLRYYGEPSSSPLKEQCFLLTAELFVQALSCVLLNANLESPGKRSWRRVA